jgi:hypothetical protein
MSREPKHLWRLDVRDRKRLIEALARAAAGDARISFEGDLSKCRLQDLPGASFEATRFLPRNTTRPVQEFVVLPLEADSVNAILDAVPAAALDEDTDRKPWPHDGDVLHVQIEKDSERWLVACDNFHPDCTWCADSIDEDLLATLLDQGVLKGFYRDTVPSG